ncbi:MAG: tyrosine-type recombinase/integrase [Kiritimatiellae bacterium]|nr:tyrosine-type recombinase/integrase [Kiritimatiellia bacterium]
MRLYKRYQTWWVEYRIDGRHVRKSTRLHDRAAAEAVLATMKLAKTKQSNAETIAGLLGSIYERVEKPAGTGLDAAWEIYRDTLATAGLDKVAADTLRKRAGHLAAFAEWCKVERPIVREIQGVDGPTAAAYAVHMSAKGLSAKTRQMHLADLSHVWRILAKSLPGIADPWANLRPRNTESQRHPAFTREEEARVMKAARDRGDGWPLMCLIARHTGLRYGDVATLTWGIAADAIKAEILENGVVDVDAGLIVVDPSKTARHGVRVVLPIERAALAPALSEARKSARKNAVDIFPRHAKTYRNIGQAPKDSRFGDILTSAGTDPSDGYSFHSWRHTFRTRLAEAGVSTELAMRLCGHTTAAMSAHYDHAAHLAEMARAIEAAAGK